MEDSGIFFWGIIAVVASSVITAAIIGTWNWASKKLDDKVRLSADVSMPGDLQVMQFIGCACMVVTVKCKGRRTAKISGALLAIEGIDLIPQFEKAFGAQFGYVPVDAGPPPALVIDLVPLREPNCSDGFILERDDAIRFAMPIQVPILHKFPTAPSQNVWIAVKFFDDSEEVILRGLQIQKVIEGLIAVWGDQKQSLNVSLRINLRANSAVPPGNPELMGKTNPHPLIFLRDETPDFVKEQIEERIGTATFSLPVYSFLSTKDSSVFMIPTPDGLLLPIISTRDIAEEIQAEATIETKILELATEEALRSFVENPSISSEDAHPDYRILFDSVDPHSRKQGIVDKSDFLASLPQS